MFCEFTYQDWELADNKESFIPLVIQRYKDSQDFTWGIEANAYFNGQNTEIMRKTLLKPEVIRTQTEEGEKKSLTSQEVIGNRLSNDFLFRFVVQQNQYLLGNGVTLKNAETKKKLGRSFDTRLQECGENALLHGVSWGYWNNDHLETISAVKDPFSGFVALCDEITSEPKVGIQFWQIGRDKPMGVRLFERDGVTVYRYPGTSIETTTKPVIVEKKRGYKVKTLRDGGGISEIIEENYQTLPVVPLFANKEKRSELTHNIKSKIDAYDRIQSDLGDNLDRANDVYWVLNNFGGDTKDVINMIEMINKVKAVLNQGNAVGGGATAEPRTIEVPYMARATALDLLKKALYQDYMALDMDEIKGGSLTNVAIKTAMANLNLKADRFEWQCFAFVQNILSFVGVDGEDAEIIRFNRRGIVNESEVIANIYMMRQDVSRQWALEANPMVNSDEIPTILAEREKDLQKDREFMLETEGRRSLIAGAVQAEKAAVKGEDYTDEKNPQRQLQAETFRQESTVEQTNGEQPKQSAQNNQEEA